MDKMKIENINTKQKLIIGTIIIIILLIIVIWNNNSKAEEVFIQNDNFLNTENLAETEINKKDDIVEQIGIHITGNIKNNGIVIVENNARIIDVIEAAGGITEKADLSQVNLAYKVSDGQKIYIPSIGEDLENQEIKYITNNSGNNVIIDGNDNKLSDKININIATQTELETLSGVGPSIAAKIINYRVQNGKFNSIEEIKNVSGIGESKYEQIKDQIKVK